jgi:hypothetical protein
MGLAMAVKQTLADRPFVVVGIVLESQRLRAGLRALHDGLRYLGIAAAAPGAEPAVPAERARRGSSGILAVTARLSRRAEAPVSLSLSLPLGGGRTRLQLRGHRSAALLACCLASYGDNEPPSCSRRLCCSSPVPSGELPGHADPGGVAAAATTPARPLRVLAALEMGGVWRGVRRLAILAALTSQPAGHVHQSVRTTGQLATVVR